MSPRTAIGGGLFVVCAGAVLLLGAAGFLSLGLAIAMFAGCTTLSAAVSLLPRRRAH